MIQRDYYQVLGVTRDTSAEDTAGTVPYSW
jgi:DnaJ-class molecular chaperone